LRKILIARRLVDKDNNTQALIIINGYDTKEYIEQNLAEPATAFVRYSNIEE
jgi:arginine decarboxylase-like protein